jgi:predicted  nucleic acid-binding Zn-ribbon protein
MRLSYNILYKVKREDILIFIKNEFRYAIKVLNLFAKDKRRDILFINFYF